MGLGLELTRAMFLGLGMSWVRCEKIVGHKKPVLGRIPAGSLVGGSREKGRSQMKGEEPEERGGATGDGNSFSQRMVDCVLD